MRIHRIWMHPVQATLLCFALAAPRVMSAPALTTVQDTLFKADGTYFNGVAYIDWKSFQAADLSNIATSSMVVPITNGSLRVRLVPTANTSGGAYYVVRYHADGKLQFTENWNVPPSSVAVNLASIRIANGAIGGGDTGGSTDPGNVAIADVTGLVDALNARPIRTVDYRRNRAIRFTSDGELTHVEGELSDCVRVDGTSGACGTGSAAVPAFIDFDVPTGLINGSNSVFTLAQPPDPVSSLSLFRNGILLKRAVDFNVSGNTVTFEPASVPQSGDLLQASYRLAGAEGVSGPGAVTALEIQAGAVSNVHVSSSAGITESKLALNYPTHSNGNDPSASEKAALSGTAGAPSASNKYVTHQDGRLSDARTALGHPLLGGSHSDTIAGTVTRGDLLVGVNSANTQWSRLPLGPANRCLMSNGLDAVWNTCLYTGFPSGTIPFVDDGGNLSQRPGRLSWDDTNRRLSIGNALGQSTLMLYDSAASGVTTLTVRAGAWQAGTPLQAWQDASGTEQARLDSEGSFSVRSVSVASGADRAGWRETGSATDPANRMDGDAWYNTATKVHKTSEANQIHATPQVICSSVGSATSALFPAQLGSCTIPAGLLQTGDRLEIRATWSHTGSAAFQTRWKWGTTVLGNFSMPGAAALAVETGSGAFSAGAVTFDQTWKAGNGGTGFYLGRLPGSYSTASTLSFEAAAGTASDSISLLQFSVVRYPTQVNP